MKKKVIDQSNIQAHFGLGQIVSFWFLWDKFPQEWVRTILTILFIAYFIGAYYQAFTSEKVNIFKDK